MRGFLVFLGATVLLGMTTNQGGAFGYVVGGLALVYVVVTGARNERSWGVGLHETQDGFEVAGLGILGGTRTMQRYLWARVDHFEAPRHGNQGRIWVVITTGRRVKLMGAKQGIRMTWQDGETYDMVGVLNQRLNDWRALNLEQLSSTRA